MILYSQLDRELEDPSLRLYEDITYYELYGADDTACEEPWAVYDPD